MVGKMVAPGVTTGELDRAAEEFIRSHGGTPSFLNFLGPNNLRFPKSSCISINEQVIHGIPGIRKLKNGDIVSVDIGAIVNGYHGDAARTFVCGTVSEKALRLVKTTEECFFEGIRYAKSGLHLHQICRAIQEYAVSNGYSVVTEYIGHGIGQTMHEDPPVPNYKQAGRGIKLQRGVTLAVEPMVNAGTGDVTVLDDKWTVVTKDGELSAHYENTIAITDGGPEILTL